MIGDARYISGGQWSVFRSRVDSVRERVREAGADELADPAVLRTLLIEICSTLDELCDVLEPAPDDDGFEGYRFDSHRGPVGV